MIANLQPYPDYKESGLLWSPRLPSHWNKERAKWLFTKMDRPAGEHEDVVMRTRHDGNRQVSFVYLEHPARRRRRVKALARVLGRGALNRLRRDGIIRDAAFGQSLLNTCAA